MNEIKEDDYDIKYEVYMHINDDGNASSELWTHDGLTHRIGGPAYFERDENGGVLYEEWRQNGVEHRIGGPAVTSRSTAINNHVVYECWMQRGHVHRTDGPAIIHYDHMTGKVTKQEWVDNSAALDIAGNEPAP